MIYCLWDTEQEKPEIIFMQPFSIQQQLNHQNVLQKTIKLLYNCHAPYSKSHDFRIQFCMYFCLK